MENHRQHRSSRSRRHGKSHRRGKKKLRKPIRNKLFIRQILIISACLISILVFTNDDFWGLKPLIIWDEEAKEEKKKDTVVDEYDFSNFQKVTEDLPRLKMFVAISRRQLLLKNHNKDVWSPPTLTIHADLDYTYKVDEYFAPGHEKIIALREFVSDQGQTLDYKNKDISRITVLVDGYDPHNERLRSYQ